MKKAKITVHPEYKIGDVDPRLYGGYLEPINNWVYGGMWNPKHPSADELGFRGDALNLIRELGIPAVRLPGGNLVSGWEWRDSIGPVENRRERLDLAWREYEPNLVGHDEYLAWAKKAGVEPLYTINLGTGDLESAMQCVDYTNHPGGTYWSELRRKHGYDKPHSVKTWCLGNEMDGPWQIRSYQKDPVEYGIKAHEISKVLKWTDPSIETVVCGTCSPLLHTYPKWDIQVLEQCYETVDYLSLHYYHGAGEGDIPGLLNASTVFEDFIRTCIASCDFIKAKLRTPRKMMISFDEYGIHLGGKHSEMKYGLAGNIPIDSYMEFSKPHLDRPFRRIDPNDTKSMQGGNEMLNTLALSSVMLTLLRYADRIKIGCMTLMIGAGIAFDRDNVWKGAVYYPVEHMIKYGQGISIQPAVISPSYDVNGYCLSQFSQLPDYPDVSCIEAACAYNEEKNEVGIFFINRSGEPIEMELDARGFENLKFSEHISMNDSTLKAINTAENPNAITPVKSKEANLQNGKIFLTAQPYSWNVVRLEA